MSSATFFKRSALFVAVATIPVLIWYLFDVILIAIGAIVLATLFRLVAEPFMRWLRFPERIALAFSVLLLIGCAGAVGYMFGAQMAGQLQDVFNRASAAQAELTESLQKSSVGHLIIGHITGPSISLPEILGKVFTVSTTFIGGLIVLVITAIYLAAQPELYRDGIIQLFPPRLHREVAETLEAIGNALRLWLLGQLLQMLMIGVLSTLAVWLIGLPSPLALGLIAGAAEFIPYIGPIIAAIPAVLVALTKDPSAVLWTLVAYLIIHQVEGNLFVPLVQRHMIYIPPAVILLGIVAIGVLFGTLSMIFAAPIAVILFVASKKLYIRDTLQEQTDLPGESA